MKTKIALAIAATLFTSASFAKDRVNLSESIDLSENAQVHFEVAVGSIQIETYDGDTIKLDIEVKESDNDWFSSADLDDVELKVRGDADDISLEIDVEDVVQTWIVKLPKTANIEIDLGVGEVEIEDFERSASIDVGVGEVDIELASDNYREIELESGVGGADLDGFKGADRERNIVNESIEWRGTGEYEIEIDVGVGDIDVRD
ncbi:hypothetical protein [Planctobacterium marinum]|uniref:Adhesin domain-containing protein n=1 Tax=Planctobacterium marinum TaxID=1631968 RepID=A0AA48KUK0_9ALTE|nr:hypothetical protein MACH26_20510 [Planctobacterium marinum]